ncbi:MAG: hypothetical protein AB6733_12810 [Clostridiaceae bacterium]
MNRYGDSKRTGGNKSSNLDESLKEIKIYIFKIEKMMNVYKSLINDLNDNKVQNFTDRMRKIRRIEQNEEIHLIFIRLMEILQKHEDIIKKVKVK